MLRRLKFFGVGVIISIIFLSIGSENRLKDTFYAYIDYFNPDKRVITQIQNSDISLYLLDSVKLDKFNLTHKDLNKVFYGGWINHEKTNTTLDPQFFVIENQIEGKNISLHCKYYAIYRDTLSKTEYVYFEIGSDISTRSYKSYFILFGIFLIIMIPVILLVRKLIKNRR